MIFINSLLLGPEEIGNLDTFFFTFSINFNLKFMEMLFIIFLKVSKIFPFPEYR